jgi:nucleotide-binding universal stress UspA family protein
MMAKRILVPLDRTQSSEAVLPLVYDLARGAGSTVRLLNVKPVPGNVVSDSGRVVAYADQEMARLEAEGLTYLDALAAQLQGVPVERVVRFGDPAHEILLEAETFGADVIALTNSGRGRLRHLLSRRIAARISRKSTVPVLLLREAPRRQVPACAPPQSNVSSWAATSRS